MFSEIAGGRAALVSIWLGDQYASDLAGWGVDGTRVLENPTMKDFQFTLN
jgi:hypothetical protein